MSLETYGFLCDGTRLSPYHTECPNSKDSLSYSLAVSTGSPASVVHFVVAVLLVAVLGGLLNHPPHESPSYRFPVSAAVTGSPLLVGHLDVVVLLAVVLSSVRVVNQLCCAHRFAFASRLDCLMHEHPTLLRSKTCNVVVMYEYDEVSNLRIEK